tara:strand:- start:2050 stop:3837 length:1788 start_codon:yes stop_codon:yes gene_type:complete
MKNKKQIEKKWKQNFLKSELVKNNNFDFNLAKTIFRGIGNLPESLSDLNCGFREFANCMDESPDYISKLEKFLAVVGIKLTEGKLLFMLNEKSILLEDVVKKTMFLYKTLFYAKESFNIYDPFSNNYGDINFFLKIELGEEEKGQLQVFDKPNEIHNQYIETPKNYEEDEFVTQLFDRIENTNDSLFITGKAGTGKSTFIHYLTRNTKKETLLLSPTGIAAVNIGGQTIHSFFHFPLKPFFPQDDEIKKFQEYWNGYNVIKNVETIIIDEVSMLRSDILEAIDYSLKINGGDRTKPFGGKQIIFVGDPYQLPPIVGSEVHHEFFIAIYNSEYFFDAPAYKELAPEKIEFMKVYRQHDMEFINKLNKVRDYKINELEIQEINNRCLRKSSLEDSNQEIRLTTNKHIARQENFRRLDLLPDQEFIFKAEIGGDFTEDKYPAPLYLRLKRDAQIMFIRNDFRNDFQERRWVNGTIAKVNFLSEDLIEVELKDGVIHKIEKEEWENRKYKWDKKEGKVCSYVVGTFRQFPLRLAWAITIHKSQGLTFKNVRVDLGSGAFSPGQLYTSLSRCKSFEGLSLVRPVSIDDIIQDERILEFTV